MKTNLILSAALSLCLCAATTAQTLPAYLPTDGLVGWWPFNGNANDESGNGNDGVVNGATLAEDRFGNVDESYLFSENTNISCPIESSDFGNDFTISMWCKFLGYTNGNEYPTILIGENYNFVLQFTNTVNPPVLQSFFGSTTPGQYDGLTRAVHSVGEWVHILILNNEGITTIKFNGNTFGVSEQASIFQSGTFGQTIRIGGGFQVPAENFNGTLDDIAIYNRALTPEEITALYTGEQVNPPAACNPLPSNLQNGLVGYWPFCGNANDESGNGNDGTVNGAALTEDRFGVANAAYAFDGESTFINVGNDLQFSELTYNAWMRPTEFANSNEEGFVIISNLHNIEPYYGNNSELYYSVNGSIIAGLSGGIWEFTNDAFYADTNIWTMVTLTYSDNVLKLYKNGSMEFEQPWGDFVLDTVDTYIGARPNNIGVSPWAIFNGSLDDIGIWNRALSAEEVQQLYTLNACTFTIYDTTNVTIYDTVSVSVSTTDTLIINTLITAVEPAQENTFLVYPNPASTQITINNGNVAILGGYTMRITNSLGQDVYNQNITQPQVTLDLSTWSGNGLYVLYIVDPQQNIVAVKQIVLQ